MCTATIPKESAMNWLRRVRDSPIAGGVVSAIGALWTGIEYFAAPDNAPFAKSRIGYALLLAVCGIAQAMWALTRENLALKAQAKPSLSLVFKPELGQPYVHKKAISERSTRCIYRVGVLNTGATVRDVRVLLRAFYPMEEKVRIKQPFELMAQPERQTRTDVNKSDEPIVFFELVSQRYGDADKFNPAYAHPPELALCLDFTVQFRGDKPIYKFSVELDGEHAGPAMDFIYSKDARGVYTLKRDFFP
jgi:hypothetical protein